MAYRTQELARAAGDLQRIPPGDANERGAKPVEQRDFMLRTPSIFGPLNSGFVPFASGAPIDQATTVDAETETAEVVAAVCGYFGFGLLSTIFGH